MVKLESDHAGALAALRKLNSDVPADHVEALSRPGGFTFGTEPQQRRVVITVDVEELQCPIELEVQIHRFLFLVVIRPYVLRKTQNLFSMTRRA